MVKEYKALVARAAGQALARRPSFIPLYSQSEAEIMAQLASIDQVLSSHQQPSPASSPQTSTRSDSSSRSTTQPSIFSESEALTQDSQSSVEVNFRPRKPIEQSRTYASQGVSGDDAPASVLLIPKPLRVRKNSSFREVDDFAVGLIEADAVQKAMRRSDIYAELGQVDVLNGGVELFLPSMFQSLCICDPNIQGHPVHLRSKYFSIGPRGLKVGRCHFLNIENVMGETCSLSSRPGPDGRPRFVLEYAAGFCSQETRACTWIMAAQMDVTNNIRALSSAILAKLNDQERPMHNKNTNELNPSVSFGIPDRQLRPRDPVSIDWLRVGMTCGGDTPKPISRHQELSPSDPGLVNLGEIVEDVKFFHRDAFVLCPARGTQFWQISSASSTLSARSDDLNAGLSWTPPQTLQRLGAALSARASVTMEVLWGVEGVRKRLYCVPLYREEFACWLCFLVDATVPDLWDMG